MTMQPTLFDLPAMQPVSTEVLMRRLAELEQADRTPSVQQSIENVCRQLAERGHIVFAGTPAELLELKEELEEQLDLMAAEGGCPEGDDCDACIAIKFKYDALLCELRDRSIDT